MSLNDRTLVKIHLGLAASTLVAVAALAWNASAIATKVDVLWCDYINRHSIASNQHPGDSRP